MRTLVAAVLALVATLLAQPSEAAPKPSVARQTAEGAASVATKEKQPPGDRHPNGVHYELGASYEFRLHMDVVTRSLDGRGDGMHRQRITAHCELTAVQHFNDSACLLALELHTLEHTATDARGREDPAGRVVDDDRLQRHPFYVVQMHTGAIASVHYPPNEDQEVIDTKKGFASTFHTRLDLFELDGPEQPSEVHGVEEDIHMPGETNGSYSLDRRGDHHIIRSYRTHNDPSHYTRSKTHGRRQILERDKSHISDTRTMEVHGRSREIRSIGMKSTVHLDHKEPRYMGMSSAEPIPGLENHRVYSHTDSTGTMTLISTTRDVEAVHDASTLPSVEKVLKGLVQDSPVVPFDPEEAWRKQAKERGEIPTAEETLACFEDNWMNAKCSGKLYNLLRVDGAALDGYRAEFDQLSPIRKAVMVDALQFTGGTREEQLWLAELVLSKTVERAVLTRGITVAHHVKQPEPELVEAMMLLSVERHPSAGNGQAVTDVKGAALLAMGSLAGRHPHFNDIVFARLEQLLYDLKHSDGSIDEMEQLGTVLRALGNQGHEGLLDLMPFFHAHQHCSVRETAAHVLRRVRSVEAEERLLWVLNHDPNATAQSAAVAALTHSERNNSHRVVDVFEQKLLTEPVIDDALEGQLLNYINAEDPDKLKACIYMREAFKHYSPMPPLRRMQSAVINGINVSLDLSGISATLIDVCK